MVTPDLYADPRLYWKRAVVDYCYAVQRIPLDPPMQAFIHSIRPPGAKKIWPIGWGAEMNEGAEKKFNGLMERLERDRTAVIDGVPLRSFGGRALDQYSEFSPNTGRGFVHKGGGGYAGAYQPGYRPEDGQFSSDTFPLIRSDGLPWLKQGTLKTHEYTVTALVRDEALNGYAYCYHTADIVHFKELDKDGPILGKLYFGDELVDTPLHIYGMGTPQPSLYFEDDKFLYRFISFNLI